MTYVGADTLKNRLTYSGDELFDYNEEKRFDDLLTELESEAVGLLESRWGDQPFTEEIDRTDVYRATDDSAMPLVYPVQEVSKVEVKRTVGSEWDQLAPERWDFDDHRIILAARARPPSMRGRYRTNPLAAHSSRATWRDYYSKIRVTYTRGWDPVPRDVQNIIVDLVENMLRDMRTEQNIAAMEPDQIESFVDSRTIMTESIKQRIDTITKPGGATMSI